MSNRPLQSVGTSFHRIGARERLTGQARFCADLTMKDLLWAVTVRSDRPHARVRKIGAARALRIPGCIAVFTHREIPGVNRFGLITKDQPLLVADKVRYVGDAVALVVAESHEAAERARLAVRVEYQDLPAIFDPEEALRPGVTAIHEKGNLLGRRVIRKGNPEEAFRQADLVIDRVYTTPHVEHTYLEPDAGLAYPGDDGTLVIHASTQNPHYDQQEVANLLGIDVSGVRIVQETTGGGFGSKLDLNVQGFVGLAAHLLHRPVKMVYAREEAYQCTSKRHPLRIHYKTGATRDGRLLAADVRIVGDTGAYASYGHAVVARSAIHATGPYEVPNVSVESVFAYTNNPVAGAMRGFGVPQTAFAVESQMDLVAEGLGLCPLELRRRNLLRIGSTTATGQELMASVGIGKTLDAVAPYYESAIREKRAHGPRRRGVGIGCMLYGIGNTGTQNPSTAQVELGPDGRITLFTGAAEIGQGSSTVLAQIVAEELALQPGEINLVQADTLRTTSAGATSASRQTYISGNAALEAVRKLKEFMLNEASTILRADKADLEVRDSAIRSRSVPAKQASFRDVARHARRGGLPLKWHGYYDPNTTPLHPETGQGIPYATYAFASQVAEVDVDFLTGEVRVLRVVAAHDVGKAINPENVRGQIYSGVAMGVGFALMEEFRPGKTESMKDYHIPTAADVPEIIPIIVEDPEPTGPFGAKGVGEPALIPTAPAIANALADALGERLYDLPFSLERVLKAASRTSGKTRAAKSFPRESDKKESTCRES